MGAELWPNPFRIDERPLPDGGVQLKLTGELDMAAAPGLQRRLDQLRARKAPVRLDLSRLEFIDSTGIRVMFQAFEHPQLNGWKFQIDPDIAPQAMQVFKLVGMDVLIVAENSTGR